MIRRIVPNIQAEDPAEARRFYVDFLGLDVLMDMGWITTFGSGELAPAQISVASEGGSGTPVPALSVEVDDVDQLYADARRLGFEIALELTDEPWGVRRFFVRDPMGTLVNVLSHAPTG